MPRVKPHHHPCADCGRKTPCPGTWEENYDGWPEVVCSEFHDMPSQSIADAVNHRTPTNSAFVCDDCAEQRQKAEA